MLQFLQKQYTLHFRQFSSIFILKRAHFNWAIKLSITDVWNNADQTISTTTIKTEPSEVPKQSIETETHETEHIGVPKMGIFGSQLKKSQNCVFLESKVFMDGFF